MKLYTDLAPWWPLISPPEEYAGEAATYVRLLSEGCAVSPRTLVEFGSGGGHNAFHLKKHFQMTLVEPARGMLEVSRALNPDCEHLSGDMRTCRLRRIFDSVFIHDAVMYMTNPADLQRAFEAAFVHLRPGGVALFAPDCVRETYRPGTEHGGSDRGERGARYLEWSFDPDESDCVYTVHYAFMLRDGQHVRIECDEHIEGLFSREEWLAGLRRAGFEPRVAGDDYGRELFVAEKAIGIGIGNRE